MEMTDIHIHILPGVDDGARNEDSTRRMLDIAYSDGIRTMICTPHFHGGHMESTKEANIEALSVVKAIANEKYPDMQFYLGNEVYYFESICEWLKDGRLSTMAESRYTLVEFSPWVTLRELDLAVRNIRRNGYIPILAHVNRYVELVENINHVYDLIDNGAYVQVNTEAIKGDMGFKIKKFTKKLLKADCIHFIASDAHSSKLRSPEIAEACKYVENKCGRDTACRIFVDNPGKVINDEMI